MKYTQAVGLKNNWLLQKVSFDFFEVSTEFIWYLDYDSKNIFVIVPKWFQTNFGSIPRIIRFIFTPTRYVWYILHDYMYTKWVKLQYQDNNEYVEVTYDRKTADKILREAIKVEWAWFIERNLIYLGVRLWGFLHFKK